MIKANDIKTKAEHFGLKQKDLVRLTNSDKSTVSRIFSETNQQEPSPGKAAAFYWLFQYLELKATIDHAKSKKTVSNAWGDKS